MKMELVMDIANLDRVAEANTWEKQSANYISITDF